MKRKRKYFWEVNLTRGGFYRGVMRRKRRGMSGENGLH